jgi:Tlde1 domain
MRTANEYSTRVETSENANAPQKPRPQRTLSQVALAGIVLASAWTAWTHLSGATGDAAMNFAERPALAVTNTVHPTVVATAYARLSTALQNQARRAATLTTDEIALFDSRFSLGYTPGTFALAATVAKGDREPMVTASLADTGIDPTAPQEAPAAPPSIRERVMAKAAAATKAVREKIRAATVRDNAKAYAAANTAQSDDHEPTIFEKLFGKPRPVTLAYASPEDGIASDGAGIGGRYDRFTAVYDISAHTVYMPDGTQLEAHSGLGPRLDDARYVHERMHGPTPPTLYDLKLREAPFHGVQAIRLVPVEEEGALGRTGLLAHTYMLGPKGDSNGCVSFRDYSAFLHAYLGQKIKRLAVVTHL